MTDNILFISAYPTVDKQKEGMFQRIKAIDMEFESYDRTYLSISLISHLKKKEMVVDNVRIIYVNWLLHFFFISKVIKDAYYIYVHSLYNFKFLIGMPLNGRNITLDLHGTVPEELDFYGKKIKSFIYGLVEKKACKVISNLIAVSYAMVDYYQKKYKLAAEIKCIVKPIFPINTICKSDSGEVGSFKKSLGINDTDVVFIYSGNLQKWQNFELMIQCIEKMDNSNYRFIILTQDKEKAEIIVSKVAEQKSIIVRSVLPEELSLYYNIAHYGFILRDDIILNRVAAPTKLIEYLSYGLIPIVKTINIGDSIRMGYEYVSYDEDLNNLLSRKSDKNKEIANSILSLNAENNIPCTCFSH